MLNIEGYFALAWAAFLLVRSGKDCAEELEAGRWWRLALLLVPLPFLPFLSFPFLADDYPHILHAHALKLSGVPELFTVPALDHFFRPAGYISYALDAQWAGVAPTLWRASGLAIHTANSVLVYLLCRTLRITIVPAVFGSLLFGLHGSRPEAVTWVSARFDLLAVLFGLICLILTLRAKHMLASAALLLAVLSKESAFVVPVLAVLLLWFAGRNRRDVLHATVPLFAVALAVFVYRWQLLGGIGGYRNAANGSPTVFDFRVTSTLQALLPRFWGTLLFPINWSTTPDTLLLVFLALCVAGLLWLATGKPFRHLLLLGAAFAYVCALPVHQFLSIGPDLEKSRVLYFASVGFAIVFASLITNRTLLVPATFVVLFQSAALAHNLEIWKRVGYQAQSACQSGARDLPNVVNGVYFLHTGYPECLKFK